MCAEEPSPQPSTVFCPTMQVVQWNLGRAECPEAQSEAGSWNRLEQGTSGIIAFSSFVLQFRFIVNRARKTTYHFLGFIVSVPLNHAFPLLDVAGGYSASMLDAVRRALDVSKILSIQDPEYNTLTFEEVFRLATLGGCQGWWTI